TGAATAAPGSGLAPLAPLDAATAQAAVRSTGSSIVDRGLALDTVDYDPAGNVSIGGRAPTAARLQVYLDNQLIGTGGGRGSGRWRVTPQAPVPEGPHTLRIDEVAEDGRVIARVESPFARGEPVVARPGDTVVVVQPGASLWRIARYSYGSGFR